MCSLCGYEIVLNVLEIFQIKNTTQIVLTLVARKVIKMLTPKQMTQRLLAQVKQVIPQKSSLMKFVRSSFLRIKKIK